MSCRERHVFLGNYPALTVCICIGSIPVHGRALLPIFVVIIQRWLRQAVWDSFLLSSCGTRRLAFDSSAEDGVAAGGGGNRWWLWERRVSGNSLTVTRLHKRLTTIKQPTLSSTYRERSRLGRSSRRSRPTSRHRSRKSSRRR